ncbi:MAG TPA: hypothetical protein VJ624_07265 [Thermodesulfobacteriota bacterium]|nr:hypothetical protein [Thermodesulfobacteriota bacterium]
MSSYPTKIAVLTHVNDNFVSGHYLLRFLVEAWKNDGVGIRILRGIEHFEPADGLILHPDLTIVPDDYLAFCRRYPLVINGGARDISKRKISSSLVNQKDSYCGPVIVKSNFNHGGKSERKKMSRWGPLYWALSSSTKWLPWSWTGRLRPHNYPIFNSSRDVPRAAWRNPHLVVEKFLPEREGAYYCLRQWIFFGDHEINHRIFSKSPIVKASNTIDHEDVLPVPEALRALRTKLQFDYGKFDYVSFNGEAILLDANRTPTVAWTTPTTRQASIVNELAQGLFSFFAKKAGEQEVAAP